MRSTRRPSALLAAALLLAALLPALAPAQEAPQEPRRQGEGRGGARPAVMGAITAISADALTVQPREGAAVTVRLTPETRFRRNREDAKLSDFKVGDRVFVAGDRVDDHTYTARLVGGGDRMGPMSPEDMVRMGLGTRFVVGEVKAIEGTKLTVLRPDGVQQTIAVDENTSFRDRNGESVALGDVAVGDHIGARGEVKGGVFVASVLRTGMEMFVQRRAPDSAPPPEDKPKP